MVIIGTSMIRRWTPGVVTVTANIRTTVIIINWRLVTCWGWSQLVNVILELVSVFINFVNQWRSSNGYGKWPRPNRSERIRGCMLTHHD
jgi:hypothetical protein